MASIRQRSGVWQARIRRKGFPEKVNSFSTKADAQRWARNIESAMDKGIHQNLRQSKDLLFTDTSVFAQGAAPSNAVTPTATVTTTVKAQTKEMKADAKADAKEAKTDAKADAKVAHVKHHARKMKARAHRKAAKAKAKAHAAEAKTDATAPK